MSTPVPSRWIIRAIKPKSIAMHRWWAINSYLFLASTGAGRESRMRRCEEHAREEAKELRTTFPEAGTE